ncbi:helix-turn-helix domain-containing protein [Xylanibacter rarus]|jgi:transcriptional regulator with XRE-family HTH domain|uniref:helix-turn-helix domain-containing protein n=1 Tax=Xylanibacter rarus TaxID=1676614 RepID=UPI0025D9D62A
MEYNLSSRVKELCRQRGIQLKDLAQKMGIAPESLSRAINGNPQLSTIKSIAENLEIPISELFTIKEQIPLNAIIVCKNKTYTAQSLSELKLYVNEIENEYTHLE